MLIYNKVMARLYVILLLLISAINLNAAVENFITADFYVAANGNDEWSGLFAAPDKAESNGPFATLARARDAVRKINRIKKGNIRVFIRGGHYLLKESVVFTLEDSPMEGQFIEYCAYIGEEPVFTSGINVDGWKRIAEPLEGLPTKAHNKVWFADVSELIRKKTGIDNRILTLYNNGKRLPRARGKGFSPTKLTSRAERYKVDPKLIHFPKDALPEIPDFREAEVVIIPCFYWVMNILPIESIDKDNLTIRTTVPGTYPLTKNGMTDRDSAWIENSISVLDEPGEWVYSSAEQRIYMWPKEGKPGDAITAPLLTELIKIEGKIDYEGPLDKPVHGLVFRGLTFTQGERMAWHGRTGRGLQHDWEIFDAPTALFRLRGAENCTIEDCTFTDSSHTAIRLDLHCKKNSISRNHIQRVGGVGILLSGYGPGTKDVNKGNSVRNNYIHDIGEVYWGSAGIFAWQSGDNRIEHNHIHHTPYCGIVVSGRIIWDPKGKGECSRTIRWKETDIRPEGKVVRRSWKEREKWLHGRRNIIANKYIHNSMEVMGDGNCIYISGTGTGNLVSKNYCHDCNGRYMNAVIRCDDDQHGTIIEKNVMQRTRGFAEGIISKGDNDIIGNIIHDLRPDGRHRALIVFPYGDITGSEIRNNVLYATRKKIVPYYEGKNRQPAPKLNTTQTDYNLYYNEAERSWASAHFRKMRPKGVDVHSLEADPHLTISENGELLLANNSPLKKLGIEALDLSKVGLKPDIRSKMYEKRIVTRISPSSCFITNTLDLTITSSEDSAQIRYTLDGSNPTEKSTLYTGRLRLSRGALVRARSFTKGGTDLTGASVRYTANPAPINEGFEKVAPGKTTPGAETQEEKGEYSARVTEEKACKGKRSLKFEDGPDQKSSFNPHVFYRTKFINAVMIGSFDVLIDKNSTFSYQWRDYASKYKNGPAVQLRKGGRVFHNKQEILILPTGKWVHFAVTCNMGEDSPGTFDLSIHLPGEKEAREFINLPCDNGFQQLDWVGFIANGVDSTVFYIDNIEVRQQRSAMKGRISPPLKY